jgi:hypothetical protein
MLSAAVCGLLACFPAVSAAPPSALDATSLAYVQCNGTTSSAKASEYHAQVYDGLHCIPPCTSWTITSQYLGGVKGTGDALSVGLVVPGTEVAVPPLHHVVVLKELEQVWHPVMGVCNMRHHCGN